LALRLLGSVVDHCIGGDKDLVFELLNFIVPEGKLFTVLEDFGLSQRGELIQSCLIVQVGSLLNSSLLAMGLHFFSTVA